MSILLTALFSTAPLLIAALGGLLSELSGRLNIGLEGAILLGAFFASLTYLLFPGPVSSVVTALLAAILVGGVSGLIIAVLHVRYSANVFIAGLGINLLAVGIIPLLSQLILGRKGVVPLNISPDVKMTIAWISVAAALILAAGVAAYLRFHIRGMRLSKIYLNEKLALEMGTAVAAYRFTAIIVSSALAGLAGGYIALYLGSYVPNLSAGKGWIALVIVFLGNRKVVPMIFAALFFAFTQIFANEIQRFLETPGLLLGLPFIITLLALILYRIMRQRISPGE
ncbi:ABC transporter permease subunit [Salinispira pacifica]|uniref:Unspecified monosaccharide ABC transport system, permease component 2 n=1 Tax=Salinispira pacifica TaxID=1307761 RepID=V5WH32_9SPIO|nr:ABC transporter permease [Salinispira pacifica]AHC15093.1 Unspecified monosaccharide ABC transport system, permease component 2 [Salinispira pacifica]